MWGYYGAVMLCASLTLLLALAASGASGIPFKRATAEERSSLAKKVRRVRRAPPSVTLEKRGEEEQGDRVFIVAALGEKPTGGYRIEITQVSLHGSTLTVEARVTVPPKGAILTQALTYPFDAVWIPADRLENRRKPLAVRLTDEQGKVLAEGGRGQPR